MTIKPIQKTTLSGNVIIGLAVIGVSVLTFSYFDIEKKWDDMHNNGLVTKAVIIKVQPTVGNKNFKNDCCYYAYTVDNQHFNFKICDCKWQVGDSIKVKYNPRKISEHEVVIKN